MLMADIDISWVQPALQNLSTEIEGLRSQLSIMRVDLSGKDWRTADEAAHYPGVSSRQFRRNAPDLGLVPRSFMGKQLYAKNELYRATENSRNWKSRGNTWRLPGSYLAPDGASAGSAAAP
jgi:hypothetical protein